MKNWEIIADNLSKAGWSWLRLSRGFRGANNLDCRRPWRTICFGDACSNSNCQRNSDCNTDAMHREMYTDTATPPYASTAPNAVKIIAASSLRFRRRTRQWIMRRIAQTFAQARFGFSIQRAMSSVSFRSTTRLESFDSSDSRLRCGRQRDPDARTQERFQGVVNHFFIVPGDRCMITSCG